MYGNPVNLEKRRGASKWKRWILLLLFLLIAPPAGSHLVAWWQARSTHLKFQIEGPFRDVNFRDVGASINACLKGDGPRLQEGRLLRSSRFFSGWWCGMVGEPQRILSLNFRPQQDEVFYCRAADGHLTQGESLHSGFELSDIEFIANWQDQRFRESVCRYIDAGLQSFEREERVLIHCDAGRDRTGALSAIFAVMALEQAGLAAESRRAAAECDYQKSESLNAHKHGRIERFIADLEDRGGGSAIRGVSVLCALDVARVERSLIHFTRSQAIRSQSQGM